MSPPPPHAPEDVATLSRSPLLARLDAAELEALLDALDEVAAPRRAEIVREGEEGDHLYFVLEGEASVRRGENLVRRLAAGDHFGELAMLGVRRRAATVAADTHVRLARLGRARFQVLAAKSPTAALHLLQGVVGSLGADIVEMTDNIASLVAHRASSRPLRVRVELPGGERVVTTGTPLGGLLPRELDGEPVLAALVDGKPAPLDATVVSDATVAPVTAKHVAGRDALRRSTSLLLLEAAARARPELELHLGQMVDDLRVVHVRGEDDRAALAAELQAALTRLVEDDVELRSDLWSVDEARAELGRRGWHAAASVLRTARAPVTTLLTAGDVHALDLGPLVPSARVLAGASLRPHPQGLLLDFGPAARTQGEEEHAASVQRELERPRYGAEMAQAHRAWLEAMGVGSVGEFNEMCVRGEIARLIRVGEGFHEKRIGVAADAIAARREELRLIGIAGPSSSGKTTFIKRLSVQLEVAGIHPIALSLDDYYLDRERSPRDEHGDYDFEALEALDLPLLREHLARLAAGERVKTPRYDFKLGKSLAEQGPELRLGPNEVLLVEGIHALNRALWPESVPASAGMRIFVHPSTTLALDRLTTTSSADLRLLRRIVRDRHQRATTAADSIQRWPSVRRGERRHIYPTFGNADVVFDTALAYELAVLKVYAERYLLEVREDHPAFSVAHRLRMLIDPIVAIYPDHVPPTSILREFIGGSGFEY